MSWSHLTLPAPLILIGSRNLTPAVIPRALAKLPTELQQECAAHEIRSLSNPAAIARHLEECKRQGLDTDAIMATMHPDKSVLILSPTTNPGPA